MQKLIHPYDYKDVTFLIGRTVTQATPAWQASCCDHVYDMYVIEEVCGVLVVMLSFSKSQSLSRCFDMDGSVHGRVQDQEVQCVDDFGHRLFVFFLHLVHPLLNAGKHGLRDQSPQALLVLAVVLLHDGVTLVDELLQHRIFHFVLPTQAVVNDHHGVLPARDLHVAVFQALGIKMYFFDQLDQTLVSPSQALIEKAERYVVGGFLSKPVHDYVAILGNVDVVVCMVVCKVVCNFVCVIVNIVVITVDMAGLR